MDRQTEQHTQAEKRKRGKKPVMVDGLQKGFELLEILASEGDSCSISALARKAGLSRYKTSRFLAVLEEQGLVECALPDGRYGPGQARRFGQKFLDGARTLRYAGVLVETVLPSPEDDLYVTIIDDAHPVLESLARRHNEAVYMAILKGEDVVLIDMVDSGQTERPESFVGKRFPFFSNAAGKVMRAIDSWDLLEKIAKKWRGGRGRYPDLEALHQELEEIREKGVAVDISGMGDGLITVAVAVKDYAGKVVGAVMMLGPSFRLLGERLEEEIIPSLRKSAELLSMKFGYVPSPTLR
ncbi:IclR family transcriptional regulator [Geomonas sp. Red276]